MSERLRRLGPRARVVMALGVAALALVPAVVSASRDRTVRSAVLLTPRAGEQARPGAVASYVDGYLAVAGVQHRIANRRSKSSYLLDLHLDEIAVAPGGPGGTGVRLGVAGRTPGEAEELAGLTAQQVVAQSRGADRRRVRARDGLRAVDRALRAPGLTAARRAKLLAERRFIAVQARDESRLVRLRVAAGPTRPDGDALDRLVSKAAAGGAPRPHPLWAGFAGLLLGLALCALWLALPARRGAP